MRYELDENEYIYKVFFGCYGESCTEYKGKIPLGYYSLEEWAEKANIRAYKIVDGNLTYDAERAAAIELEMKKGFFPNKFVPYEIIIGEWFGKPLYRKVISIGPVSTTEIATPTGVENIEQVVDIKGGGTMIAGQFLKWGFENAGGFCSCYYELSSNKVKSIVSTTAYNLKQAYAILEYTKTTDETKEEGNFFEEPDLSIDVLTIKVENENLILENTLSTVNNETLTINVDANVNEEVIKFG